MNFYNMKTSGVTISVNQPYSLSPEILRYNSTNDSFTVNVDTSKPNYINVIIINTSTNNSISLDIFYSDTDKRW